MEAKIQQGDLFISECRTRIPFGFGGSALTEAPLLMLRVVLEDKQGARATGFASDLLVPKWFEKDPRLSSGEDVARLVASAREALSLALDAGSAPLTVFDLWHHVYRRRVLDAKESDPPALLRGFGVALLERAAMDASCRLQGISFFDALKRGAFGFRPERVHPELDGYDLAKSLPAEPLAHVTIRHTVGLLDPIRADDVASADRVKDGLPQALEEDIATYGLDHFKIKLSGDADADVERLLKIAEVCEEQLQLRTRFTLDGNEQFERIADVVALLDELARHARGQRFLGGLLYVEQPLRRAYTFDPDRHTAMERLSTYAPAIIDEADSDPSALKRARALGYRGVSVKNCKGVFRALLGRGLCELFGNGLFQSAEDLTTLPIVSLQQDLATVAALALPTVERNGHHYFRGLDHLPKSEVEEALALHPDLYRRRNGGAMLAIADGRIRMQSLQCPGFGYRPKVDVAARTPIDRWVASG